MRREFSDAIERIAIEDEKIIFITGDLGYNALENLKQKLGNRFINAGVAEQNMVGMAAGLAYKGYKVFCYSIAPFIVYRCLEQFRNDVCLHNLPVFLVGNGGGYGYGIMGSSHHAIEDMAALSSLQNVSCWIPAFSDEVSVMVNSIVDRKKPAYLRLGVGIKAPVPIIHHDGSFRLVQVNASPKLTIVVLGPLVGNVILATQQLNATEDINILTVLRLPLEFDEECISIFTSCDRLLIIEEHVSIGGIGQQISIKLLEHAIQIKKFKSIRAEGYPDGIYGDQSFHQKQSGLDLENIKVAISEMIG
jgi:transketolase